MRQDSCHGSASNYLMQSTQGCVNTRKEKLVETEKDKHDTFVILSGRVLGKCVSFLTNALLNHLPYR